MLYMFYSVYIRNTDRYVKATQIHLHLPSTLRMNSRSRKTARVGAVITATLAVAVALFMACAMRHFVNAVLP